ncbi:MAG: redoxin domain-containing protein [Bacteroidales bacterium]|nr:redoxin domain-containing protein [Bacteroidales bacterium]
MKFQHNISLILLFLFATVLSYSQEKQNEAIDFTLTSTEGVEVNLFNELDNDKTILLNFFSTSCGSCVIEAPKIDSIYQQFGSGTEQLLVWGIASPESPLLGIDNFIANTEIRYPCFTTQGTTDVFELYGILYTPMLLIVCDYMVSPSISYNEIIENLNYCFPTKIEIVEVYPEIYSKNELLYIKNPYNEDVSMRIFDITGRLILSDRLSAGLSKTYSRLDSNQIYIVNLLSVSGKTQSQKVILK